MHVSDQRANRLFVVLAGFFLTNALLAEFVGVKIFSLEATLGISPIEWSLLGVDRKSTRLNSSHVSESRMPSSA